MSEAQSDLFLPHALTELERLMVVWSDPTVARAASLSINNFINSKVQEIKSRCTSPSHVLSFDNFRSLLEIYKSIKSLGNAEAADSVTAFLVDKIQQKVESHPSKSTSDAARMSALELFEDLEFWVALKSLLEGSFSPGTITDSITKLILLDLAACPTDVIAIPESLRVMEIGAYLMGALPSMELTAAKNTHAKITTDLQTQIRRLQEQAVQNEATISRLNQDQEFWIQENIGLEADVHGLTQQLSSIQSPDPELQQENLGLQTEIADLEAENAGLEKKSRHLKSKLRNRIRKLKDEVSILRQALLDQKYAHDTDDKIYDASFQGRAEKLTEELAEVEEDKAALARDNDRLAVEQARVMESLAELEDSKIAMSNEIHRLGTENDRLEQELKDASDSLEEAEDDRAMLSRNAEKLTSEQARLEKELSDAQDILHRISFFSSSIRPIANYTTSQEANTDANANADTDTATSSTGVLTPPSSTPTTPW
ncbi:hypothetical protein HO133_003993 [Letharia lupina]|uniref:Uncharacterized protein n=1 Tax=Letharia lupina TaxID=560253 RepID=A0A8H6C9W4_9LECA|nr:uncharacterized protein HO133_003993 [Letharia lupina]KAF6219524.1 hypothetical protein HO133_003993 [Letharia lupina]